MKTLGNIFYLNILAIVLGCSLNMVVFAGGDQSTETAVERHDRLFQDYRKLMEHKVSLRIKAETKWALDNLDLDHFEAMASALHLNESLQVLSLSATGMDDKKAKAIAEALEFNKTLRQLDISDNHITDKGAGYFLKALKQNKTLELLFFHGNNIGKDKTSAIQNMLSFNENYRNFPALVRRYKEKMKGESAVLDVRSAEDARAVAEALKENKTLVELEIAGGKFLGFGRNMGFEEVKAIAQALKHNKTLTKLDFGLHDFTPAGMKAIEEMLQSNARLTEIRIWTGYGKEGRDIRKSIDLLLDRNKKIAELWNKLKSLAPAILAQNTGSAFDALPPELKLTILSKLADLYLK